MYVSYSLAGCRLGFVTIERVAGLVDDSWPETSQTMSEIG